MRSVEKTKLCHQLTAKTAEDSNNNRRQQKQPNTAKTAEAEAEEKNVADCLNARTRSNKAHTNPNALQSVP